MEPLASRVCAWYAVAARDLPWRAPGVCPYGVLVSEVMLQQTPVARVVGPWQEWLKRWPTLAALADASPADVVRQWGRLGYPRRALRLRETALACIRDHDGELPTSVDELLALPGIGTYTARAIAAFAYGQRVPVVDTNVRRVLARHDDGRADASPTGAGSRRELAACEAHLPDDPPAAARTSIALMELGALVCTATRAPDCDRCPLSASCAWLAVGRPVDPLAPPARRPQAYAGTDRQVRGVLLAILREASEPVPPARLAQGWDDETQRARALESLLADGLAAQLPDGRVALPA